MRTLSASLPPNLHWPGSDPWSRPQKSTFLFGTSQSADWNRGPVNRARSVLSQALPLWWEVWGRGKGVMPSRDFPGARTPSRPHRSSLSPTVDQNKRSPPLSQSPGSAARNTPDVLLVPPETPAPRGKEGQQPSFPTAAVSRGGEVRVGVPLSTGKWPQDRYSVAAPGGMRQEAGRVLAGSAGGPRRPCGSGGCVKCEARAAGSQRPRPRAGAASRPDSVAGGGDNSSAHFLVPRQLG